jgi:putative addiction module killer protein
MVSEGGLLMTKDFDISRTVLYKGQKYSIRQTLDFAAWLGRLRDKEGRLRILARLRRLADGNPGDYKAVGDGVLELRLMFGPGYRAYFTYQDDVVVLLLVGGDKSTQSRDIEWAKQLAGQVRDGAKDDGF